MSDAKPISAKYPKIVIVNTSDIIVNFMNSVRGILLETDLNEIVTQAVAMLLNGDGNIAGYIEDFPDYTKLISHDFLNDQEKVTKLETSVNELIINLYNRLKQDGIFVDNKLNYFFDRFIGNDIVLHYLPY